MILIPVFRIIYLMEGHEAVATALPITIPTTLLGAINFHSKGLVKVKTALTCGIIGAFFSIGGAILTENVSGQFLMVASAALFFLMAYITYTHKEEATRAKDCVDLVPNHEKFIKSAGIGAVGGFLSGFLGIGGGAILVPLLMKERRMGVHSAVATSLAIISVYAIPGAIAHFELGNVDVGVMIPTLAGSLIGVAIGAKHSVSMDDSGRKTMLAAFLALMGALILAKEAFSAFGAP